MDTPFALSSHTLAPPQVVVIQNQSSHCHDLSLSNLRNSQSTRYASNATTTPSHFNTPRKPIHYDMVPSYEIPCAFPTISVYRQSLANQTNQTLPGISSRIPRGTHPINTVTSPYSDVSSTQCSEETVVSAESHRYTEETEIGIDMDTLAVTLGTEGPVKGAEKSRILALRGKKARDILDKLQKWLEANPRHPCKRKVLRLLVGLASSSHELPASLFVSGLSGVSCHPQGFGGFADVFLSSYYGQPVAVKRLRINATGWAKERTHWEFCKESLVWRQLVHPNILTFIGVDKATFKETGCIALVSPWMARGTIMSYICSEHYNAHIDRLRLIIEIAEGLKYLHEQEFAHGDLHGDNVLITAGGHARLSDFGLAVVGDVTLSRHPTATRNNAGAFRWLAPEYTSADPEVARKRPAGDVFAFGRLCLAICNKRVPFHEQTAVSVLLGLAENKRPPCPSAAECYGYPISEGLWWLVNECWALQPSARPLMVDVIVRLYAMN